MNDTLDFADDPSEAEMLKLASLLARADVWVDAATELEDSVVLAIGAEARETSTESTSAVTMIGHRRKPDTYVRWLSAAAATVLAVGGIALIAGGDDNDPAAGESTFVLDGTDAAPDAFGHVNLSATPAGLKILLDANGLGAAPSGYFYEAWLSDGSNRVSAGTFHMRGGYSEIELWAGVTDPAFNRMAITLEPLDGDTDSSGDVRLAGDIAIGG